MFIDKENGVWHRLRSSSVQNNGAIVQIQTHDDYDECARQQSNKNASNGKFPQQGFLASRYITNFAFHAADVEVHFLFSKKNPSFNIPLLTVNSFLMINVRTVSEYQISNIPITLPWTNVCSIKDVGQSQYIIDNGQNWQKNILSLGRTGPRSLQNNLNPHCPFSIG